MLTFYAMFGLAFESFQCGVDAASTGVGQPICAATPGAQYTWRSIGAVQMSLVPCLCKGAAIFLTAVRASGCKTLASTSN